MTLYHFNTGLKEIEINFEMKRWRWVVTPHYLQKNTKKWVAYHGLNQSVLAVAYDDHSIHDIHISRQER